MLQFATSDATLYTKATDTFGIKRAILLSSKNHTSILVNRSGKTRVKHIIHSKNGGNNNDN